ncbi:hypothetical protein TMatcc_002170 [Talaromyces marneffei ATCC 18224]|uniref:Chitinase n=2 Tax=Talaromyces marneffei TaxID=37727 RepID=B6QIW7_TALMQ|nr:uncharacterized protein EYB26_006653 [Talaromyces marneffei]EEA23312.1 conserved hypothetical protein [Talaromyces marneffei ATCC 18224]KAE8552159.1 hypothetical protein EYB25_006053 [Talaromyces marneffei]QGA18968.1 hypothetical protein EYB26_006653 [Talaromyces marneffei]
MKAQFIAAAAGLFAGALGQQTIFSGAGFGTYYFDVDQVDACGTSFKYQNMGPVMCNHDTALTLNDINSNYIVAMNNTQLRSNLGLYCGKKVVVSFNGVPSNIPLFIGDGCERCGLGSPDASTWNSQGAPGLDFSLSVLDEISGGVACADGHADITWEILDETLYNFDTNAPGQPTGPVPPS